MSLEKRPDYLFEVSWEVCNKIGGIHTVIATKAYNLSTEYGDSHILIGPDVWRDTDNNPEFEEDELLFKSWRMQAAEEGLRVRLGRWMTNGRPIVILVDFTQFIEKKNDIFTELWKRFSLDSLSGGWDYTEPALFGYASGKVIESFVKFNLHSHNKVVAQFHEWMTGAGILYLKQQNLSIATVFTTHATVVGRCLACNNLPLYDNMASYNGDEKAAQFNVTAKHSLEKVSAANADIFTTVSNITAKECRQFLGKAVDIITPNGFDPTFLPDNKELWDKKRIAAREKMLEVASAMHGKSYDKDTCIIGISGRYEFKNKGIDIFIDALGKLKENGYSGKQILACIMIPAGINGPDKELALRLKGESNENGIISTTHILQDPEYDSILAYIKRHSLAENSAVDVMYVPSYLKGDDGIFDMPYYDLLIGMDLTAFPSYYEPWGYTPLESLAFKVPTITTSLAGFGRWVKENYKGDIKAIEIIERNDANYNAVVDGVVGKIIDIVELTEQQKSEYADNASDISKVALWANNIKYYNAAYERAMEKTRAIKGLNPVGKEEPVQTFSRFRSNLPEWKSFIVNKHLPDRLKTLDTLSKNLWWCWNQEALDLFKMADPDLWTKCGFNPIALLDSISLKHYKILSENKEFTDKLDKVYSDFMEYMSMPKDNKTPNISYFCMEYGLDTSLKIYSGGLGILAGDYLKEASDMNVNMTAVGFLYKYGYFTQKLSGRGEQEAYYEPQDFSKTPAVPCMDGAGNWVTVSVAFPGRNVYARVWRVEVGRVNLYLLDTDFEDNQPEDRSISHQLYGGDWENRLKQELILGIGGIRALRALGVNSEVYHCNEGHAAFIGMERLREYVQNDNLSFNEAVEVVRSTSLFTTHTPVPAGHDAFSTDMLRKYIPHYAGRLKIDWETLLSLGMINPYDANEKFSMSHLAANLSQDVNGVSWLHGKVSQDIFANMWPGYLPEELNVGYVTNGVHYQTWTAKEWKEVHARVFGKEFSSHHYDKSCFQGIRTVGEEEIWSIRKSLKTKLIRKVKEILSNPSATNHYSPKDIVKIKETLRDDILTIGFARRFATYKRAYLLFRDLDRLNDIVNNPKHPVQFLFAGKAHPADKAGQDLIKHIVEVSKMPQFIGKIVFIPNYDITIAKMLVQGVDIWMNTPTRPLEASGTSGEKATMNGVMHFSVLDGWWVEGYKDGAGWALPMERTYTDQNFQDELDAATIYNIIEDEIAPRYYDVDRRGISHEWIETIKNCVAEVACNFTTNRMMEDYIRQYYLPLADRGAKIVANDFEMARDIAQWKKKMRRAWDGIEIMGYSKLSNLSGALLIGKDYESEVTLNLGDIEPQNIGLEIVLVQNEKDRLSVKQRAEFTPKECNRGIATYVCKLTPEATGTYMGCCRMYAKNPLMAHRQDFELVRWL